MSKRIAVPAIALIAFLAGALHAGVASHPYPADGEMGMSPASVSLGAVVQGPGGPGGPVDVRFYGREKPDFTIVVLPDTQYYSRHHPEIFDAQTQWIVDNAVARHIVFVAHEGDITNAHRGRQIEWDRARASMSLLDGVVPYGVLAGNHDDQGWFNDYFPCTQYGNAGHWPHKENDNSFALISAGGVDLVIVSLSYDPDASAIRWAKSILRTHSDRLGIIVTHSYLSTSGNLTHSGGTAIWDGLVDAPDVDNVYFVLCGHRHGECTVTDTANGHQVHQLLADYQTRSHGGDGWLRIMTFAPEQGKVYVETYSPWLDDYERDSDSEFVLDLPMSVKGTDYEPLGASHAVRSGRVITSDWSGLHPDTAYEWYVAVTDPNSSRTVKGPVWGFTTTASSVGAVPVPIHDG